MDNEILEILESKIDDNTMDVKEMKSGFSKIKMYAYEVYDFNYDDTKSFVLMHERKFTKEEYENIINECREKVCCDEWDLYKNIHSMLIKEYGFKEIDIQCTYTLHGGAYGKGQIVENRVVEAEIE